MDEVFPVVAGIAVGLLVRLLPSGVRIPALGVLSAVFGALASLASGELAISWGYLLIDIAQVLGAALLTFVLVARWRRRAVRLP